MMLSPLQTLIIILMVTLGTVITRFLPFVIFSDNEKTHPHIVYLGKMLPYAVIGMLLVYCLKGVKLTQHAYGLPELLAFISIFILHNWKKNSLISIGGGTVIYMLLVQFVFI